MEENEISTENTAEEAEEKEETAEAEEAAEQENGAEEIEGEAEENATETETAAESDDAEAISAEAFAKTLANPMFAVFARGRSGGIEEAVRDFEKMLAAGRGALTEEMLMKMTPGAGGALGGAALSEHQRRIAREAGMSYREYYEIIRTIPAKNK
jgi:hypothetical protein